MNRRAVVKVKVGRRIIGFLVIYDVPFFLVFAHSRRLQCNTVYSAERASKYPKSVLGPEP